MAKRIELTFEEVEKIVFEINPNIELMQDFYVNVSEKIKCRCKVCGNLFGSSLSNIKRGRGCRKCAFVKLANDRKRTLEYVIETIGEISPNIRILSTEYTNNREKLECECLIDGHIWKADFSHLQNRRGCPECRRKKLAEIAQQKRLTISEVVNRMSKINPMIRILSTEYADAKALLKCECLIDGHIWEVNFNNLQSGKGCPACALNSRSGENHFNWKGGITPIHLYLRGHISQWKKESRKASNYKCVISGDTSEHIHHIHGFDLILKETLAIENIEIRPSIADYSNEELLSLGKTFLEVHSKYGLGVAISESEHVLFHQKYGYGKNNSKQWGEFFKDRKEFYDKDFDR